MLWAKPCHYEKLICATHGWDGDGSDDCMCQEGPSGLAGLRLVFPDPWETSMGCKRWCVPWASRGGSTNLHMYVGTLPGSRSQLLEAVVRALTRATMTDGVTSALVTGGAWARRAMTEGFVMKQTVLDSRIKASR